MACLRTSLHTHRALAALLLALVLCIKALIPGGYMVAKADMTLTVSICADATGQSLTRQITIPASDGNGHEQGQPSGDCPYAPLSMAALGGVDGVLLAMGLAFILALGCAPQSAVPRRMAARLRPPSQGPPRAA